MSEPAFLYTSGDHRETLHRAVRRAPRRCGTISLPPPRPSAKERLRSRNVLLKRSRGMRDEPVHFVRSAICGYTLPVSRNCTLTRKGMVRTMSLSRTPHSRLQANLHPTNGVPRLAHNHAMHTSAYLLTAAFLCHKLEDVALLRCQRLSDVPWFSHRSASCRS